MILSPMCHHLGYISVLKTQTTHGFHCVGPTIHEQWYLKAHFLNNPNKLYKKKCICDEKQDLKVATESEMVSTIK